MKKTKSTPRATPRRCAVSTGSASRDAYHAGYRTQRQGSFFRPNPHPESVELADAWDQGYKHAEYDELREERDEARAQLAVAFTAANAEELRQAQAELAALRQDKERLDWLENREPDAALWDYVADAINIRAAINVAMKEVQL